MKTGESVWLVESGEYSAYKVAAIFASEQQAVEFSSHLPDSTVREHVLDSWTPEQATFEIELDLDGNIIEVKESAHTDAPDAPSRLFGEVYSGRRGKDKIRVYVKKGPRERAIKIAADRVMRIKTVLDDADERMLRTGITFGDGPDWGDAHDAALVLCGINTPPKLPAENLHCFHILQILGVIEKSPDSVFWEG